MSTKNIIVSAGHGGNDPGAITDSTVEHLHAYLIAWWLRAELEAKNRGTVFISCFQSLEQKIKEVNKRHAVKPVDLAIEIHLNWWGTPQAHGTEVLFYSPKNKAVAAQISKTLSAAIGTRDRGAKKRDNLGWLKQTQPPALIIEVCFISNPDDVGKLATPDFHQLVAKAIAKEI